MMRCYVCDERIMPNEVADEANVDREFVEFEDEWFHIDCLLAAGIVRDDDTGEYYDPAVEQQVRATNYEGLATSLRQQ